MPCHMARISQAITYHMDEVTPGLFSKKDSQCAAQDKALRTLPLTCIAASHHTTSGTPQLQLCETLPSSIRITELCAYL